MLPIFLYPLALLGFAAVPALVGIYLFRNRFQPMVVSSLMLWVDPRESQEGGRQIRRLKTPLLFFLELLALLLLILAAADPQVRLPTGARPLVIVLDDSYSMLAGKNTTGESSTPRALAIQAIKDELGRQLPYVTRLLVASDKPKLLGPPMRSSREILEQLQNWSCSSGFANIGDAVALAGEIGGDNTLVLVVSDHTSEAAIPDKSRLQWWSFGKPRANGAIISATRAEKDGADRIMLEAANIATEKSQLGLTLSRIDNDQEILNKTLSLGPNEVSRIVTTLPPGTGPIRARLDDRELPIDSQVVLEPFPERPVNTEVRMSAGPLRDVLEKALSSTRQSRTKGGTAQLLFTDKEDPGETERAWTVQFLAEKEANAYSGPFILDRAHPLTAGLSLQGVVWGAGKDPKSEGNPVAMAGDIPLLTDREIGAETPRHALRFRLRSDLSTLQSSPDWPILIWNLVSWRSAHLPGLSRSNLRLGDTTTLTLEKPGETVTVTSPSGIKKEIQVRNRQVQISGDEVGVHKIQSPTMEALFAVNTVSRNESDLTKAETGQWGSWLDEETVRMDYLEINWILLLLVLGLITVHLLLLARSNAGSASIPSKGAGATLRSMRPAAASAGSTQERLAP